MEVAYDLPWATPASELLQMAKGLPESVCCVFLVAGAIPAEARKGFAALVMAYTRESEPVAVLDDGSAALLVTEGGTDSARVVAQRVQAALDKLGLKKTVRIGICDMKAKDPIAQAHAAAERAEPGAIEADR